MGSTTWAELDVVDTAGRRSGPALGGFVAARGNSQLRRRGGSTAGGEGPDVVELWPRPPASFDTCSGGAT
jgi:hypothetical protein